LEFQCSGGLQFLGRLQVEPAPGRARTRWNAKQKIKNVWQAKDFKSFVFVSVAGKGLTGANFVSVAGKGVTGFLDLGRRWVGCRKVYRKRRADHKRNYIMDSEDCQEILLTKWYQFELRVN